MTKEKDSELEKEAEREVLTSLLNLSRGDKRPDVYFTPRYISSNLSGSAKGLSTSRVSKILETYVGNGFVTPSETIDVGVMGETRERSYRIMGRHTETAKSVISSL